MKPPSSQRGRSALELLEEAVHLLRAAPVRAFLAYYAGALPYALGLLFFCADMSRGAFAERRCPAFALGMAVLFVWMKCWQSVFVSALRAGLTAEAENRWSPERVARLVFVQGIVQPSRLFLLPAAFVVTIPFAWVAAFYENVTVLGEGSESSVRSVLRRAGKQAGLWPKQNHLLLLMLSLAGLVLWLNAVIAVVTLPQLLKTFLGVETAFSRAGFWVVSNTTFLSVTLVLAWLALDPLIKAIYLLRCFRGEALRDGADLLAELSWVQAAGRRIAATGVILGFFCAFSFYATAAADTPVAPSHEDESVTSRPSRMISAPIPPEQLDSAVKETLRRDKYAWRLPREKLAEDDTGAKAWLRTFFTSIGDTLGQWARSVRDWIRSLVDWFNRLFRRERPAVDDGDSGPNNWAGALRWLAYALLGLAVAALVALAVRLWRQGWRRREIIQAEVVAARPNLNDENVTAAQLPEEEWLKLARELLDRGDLRLALRAFYLATLAHLAAREIVTLSRFKSNRDYEIEVNRRARGSSELRSAFSSNVSSFDRAWYGLYDVTADGMAQFQSNFERIRSC